jgi:hypothetical protein
MLVITAMGACACAMPWTPSPRLRCWYATARAPYAGGWGRAPWSRRAPSGEDRKARGRQIHPRRNAAERGVQLASRRGRGGGRIQVLLVFLGADGRDQGGDPAVFSGVKPGSPTESSPPWFQARQSPGPFAPVNPRPLRSRRSPLARGLGRSSGRSRRCGFRPTGRWPRRGW